MNWQKSLKITVWLLVVATGFATALHVKTAVYIAHPKIQLLALDSPLVSLKAPTGQWRLNHSKFRSDYELLESFFEPQVYLSFCGVATGVVALNALEQDTAYHQSRWFDNQPSHLRSAFETFFGGMSLRDFDQLIRAKGFQTQRIHGDALTLEKLRRLLKKNLAQASDVLVINYHRGALGQKGGGHFSPIGAYHEQSDSVLIMDVAAHKYPPTWVPVPAVLEAMNTEDKSAGAKRGLIQIFKPSLGRI